MNESMIDNTEEKILTNEISDAALEIAAGIANAGTVSLTIAFCSGLDYCQPKSPHAGQNDLDNGVYQPQALMAPAA